MIHNIMHTFKYITYMYIMYVHVCISQIFHEYILMFYKFQQTKVMLYQMFDHIPYEDTL